jgi:hypothetical protein
MATDGIFVDEGGGVVRMNPAAVSLAHYATRVGKGATTPLQVLASIAREECSRKDDKAILMGKVEGGMVWVCSIVGDAVYKLHCKPFGIDIKTHNSLAGKQWYVRLPELLAEIPLRKDAEKIVEACNRKRTKYRNATLSDSQLMGRADNLVPHWRTMKAAERLAPIVDALRRLQSADAPTVAKAATPVPPKPATPAKEPAPMPKPTAKPPLAPESKPTPAPTGPELSPHARALIDALAKIGTPAVKATMLQAAGIPASAWSDALSEAYRARKITRDRSRTDNVYHVLAK